MQKPSNQPKLRWSYKRKPPNLSELTPLIFYTRLTHLGSKAFKYTLTWRQDRPEGVYSIFDDDMTDTWEMPKFMWIYRPTHLYFTPRPIDYIYCFWNKNKLLLVVFALNFYFNLLNVIFALNILYGGLRA